MSYRLIIFEYLRGKAALCLDFAFLGKQRDMQKDVRRTPASSQFNL